MLHVGAVHAAAAAAVAVAIADDDDDADAAAWPIVIALWHCVVLLITAHLSGSCSRFQSRCRLSVLCALREISAAHNKSVKKTEYSKVAQELLAFKGVSLLILISAEYAIV